MRVPLRALLIPLALASCDAPRPQGQTCQAVKTGVPAEAAVAAVGRPAGKPPSAAGGDTAPPPVRHVNRRNNPYIRDLLNAHRERQQRAPGRPTRVLAISAGGQWGAYGVGVLTGLAATATPPSFDIVTGASTGALIAPLIFVHDYETAKRVYTTVSTDGIYRRRHVWELLWSDSLVDTAPLQETVRAIVTDDMVRKIAAEGERGRILSVAAVDLDLGDPVIFDLTAIARGQSPSCGAQVAARDCIAAAILAAAAIPVGFPPVYIEDEMFVDGGLRDYAFTIRVTNSTLHNPEATDRQISSNGSLALAADPDGGDGGAMELTLIANTDFQYGTACTEDNILGIATRTASIAIDQISVGAFYRLLSEVRSHPGNTARYTFADPALTQCAPPRAAGTGLDAFDQQYMRCLFRRGCEMAYAGEPIWHGDANDLPHSPTARAPSPPTAALRPAVPAPAICTVAD